MSEYEKQQELLHQFKIENQQLLKFKKLNNLIKDTLDSFASNAQQQSPLKALFDILEQELHADHQAILALDDDQMHFSIIASTHAGLSKLAAQQLQGHGDTNKHPFTDAAIYFNLDLITHWPQSIRAIVPDVRSVLTQPVSVGSHNYAIILMSNKKHGYSNEAKTLLSSYSNFIASFLSIFEHQRLAAERDRLFAQQKRIEQSMIKQDKLAAIGQLAAGVAHELNNPLAFIYSNLNTLKVYIQTLNDFVHKACDTSPALLEAAKQADLRFIMSDSIELIDESLIGARRSRDIINNLRTFSHPDDTSVAPLDIVSLLESTIRIANTQIKRRAIISFVKDCEQSMVRGNATQLSQVFLNLINNAYQAIEHNMGQINVSINLHDGWLNIKITDNGSGISQNSLPHIFEPFFTTKDVGKGTGLGLSISQAIAEQHGGCLALEQTGPDGTTFVVSLPQLDVKTDD